MSFVCSDDCQLGILFTVYDSFGTIAELKKISSFPYNDLNEIEKWLSYDKQLECEDNKPLLYWNDLVRKIVFNKL